MTKTAEENIFVLCIDNRECHDLQKGKVYSVIKDSDANEDGFFRVIDESGEDYLYPASYFVSVDLPSEAKTALGNEC